MAETFVLNINPNYITELRKERRITVKELARQAGVGESTIWNLKCDGRHGSIKAETVERLAAVLEVEPETVFPDYARAKKDHAEKREREKEHIFSSREERDEAIESVRYLAVYIAKKNTWRIEKCRNNVMDMEDLIGEALLTLVETAEKVSKEGITRNMEFSKYAGFAMEYRFKTIQGSQMRQKRTAYFNVSLDAQIPGTDTTYQEYLESVAPRMKTPEEIVILREECREAVRMLPPERRHEPEIVALLQQIAI